jgi:AraC-like DNA-binding protein
MGLVAYGRRRDRHGSAEASSPHPEVEIRSLIPSDPFAGVTPRFGDDTKVLFVVEGAKAVALRRNISVRTLLRRFHEGGTNPSRVRQECRAGLVAILLERGHAVNTVARAVGLSGPQALGRFVRGCFGMTPSRFREQLRSGRASNR